MSSGLILYGRCTYISRFVAPAFVLEDEGEKVRDAAKVKQRRFCPLAGLSC